VKENGGRCVPVVIFKVRFPSLPLIVLPASNLISQLFSLSHPSPPLHPSRLSFVFCQVRSVNRVLVKNERLSFYFGLVRHSRFRVSLSPFRHF